MYAAIGKIPLGRIKIRFHLNFLSCTEQAKSPERVSTDVLNAVK